MNKGKVLFDSRRLTDEELKEKGLPTMHEFQVIGEDIIRLMSNDGPWDSFTDISIEDMEAILTFSKSIIIRSKLTINTNNKED